MNIKCAKLKLIACLYLLSMSGSVLAGSSSIVCQFDSGTWNWGLNADNSYYYPSGTWVTTSYTKITKFSTTASYASIYQSCVQSQSYYQITGNLMAVFAATSGSGSNYPIVLGGGELFPQY